MVTQKEIFFQYIINERSKLEADVAQLRQNIRYRNIDAIDCLELLLAMERLNSFKNYCDHAIAIFKLSCPADYEAQIINIDYTMYRKAAEELKKHLTKKG